MTILKCKHHFFDSLSHIYPKSELISFFDRLCLHHLNLSRVDVALYPKKELSGISVAFFKNAIEQLKKHYPIQYLIGSTSFYGLSFKVNESVLIPRPETEELVDWILNEHTSKKRLSILDIGTGSGCIGITLAKKLPEAKITLLDISEEALQLAKLNAEINDVKVSFIQKDILSESELKGHFDIIVSNPPYVLNSERISMEDNVLKYEPSIALFVENDDPLLFYRKIAQLVYKLTSENVALYFEINEAYGAETVNLLKTAGFTNITLKKDLYGKDRMIRAIRSKN